MPITTASNLIHLSVRQNCIVHHPYDASISYDLLTSSDGDVHHGRGPDTVHEYWGTDEDGDNWRVHLTGAAS